MTDMGISLTSKRWNVERRRRQATRRGPALRGSKKARGVPHFEDFVRNDGLVLQGRVPRAKTARGAPAKQVKW